MVGPMSDGEQCAGCGQAYKPGAAFCNKCGQRRGLTARPAEPVAPPPIAAPPPVAAPAVAPPPVVTPPPVAAPPPVAHVSGTPVQCWKCGAYADSPDAAQCAYCRAVFAHAVRPAAPSAVEGAPASKAAPAPRSAPSVEDWTRPADVIVSRVGTRDLLRGLLSSDWRVPRGSYAAVLGSDGVKEILAPGAVVSSGWWQNLQAAVAGHLDAGEVVLLDVRPVPVPYTVEYRRAGGAELVRLGVVVEVSLPRDDKAQLGYFLEQVLHREDQLTARSFHDLLKPHVAEIIQEATRYWSSGEPQDLDAARDLLETALAPTLAERYALAVRVSVSEQGRAFVLEETLGATPAAAPARRCPACASDVAGGRPTCSHCNFVMPVVASGAGACAQCRTALKPQARFCHVCRTPVPADASATADAVLRTRDGRYVQVDVVLRGDKEEGSAEAAHVLPIVRAQLGQMLEGVEFAKLRGADDLGRLEGQVQAACARAVEGRGIRGLKVTLVDVREVGQAWLLAARAEIDRAKQSYTLGREWLTVDAQGVDLRVAALDHALRAKQVERDHGQREAQAELDGKFTSDAAKMADERRREALRIEEMNLRSEGQKRGVTQALEGQTAVATVAANAAAIAHATAQRAAENAQAAVVQGHGHASVNAGWMRTEGSAAAAHGRTEGLADAQHGQNLEGIRTATKIAQAHGEAQVTSTRVRTAADDAAYAEETKIKLERSADEVKLAKMEALARMDAKIRAEEAQEQAAAHARELESKRAEHAHASETLNQYKGMTTEQILAVQMGTSPNAAVIASAFTASADTSRTREIEERARAEVAASRAEADRRAAMEREATNAAHAQMAAQMAQTLAAMNNLAMAAVQGQGARAQETSALHAASADRAERMATASMNAMAGAVSGRPPLAGGMPRGVVGCANCGAPIDGRFCDKCGATHA